MPVAPVPPSPPQQPQPQGAAPGTGQPPFGSSPATGPTPNRGYEVAGQKLVGLALLILEQAQPLVGSGSEPGKIVHRCIGDLAKIVPPGTVTPADVQKGMQALLMKQSQFNQTQQRLQQQQQAPQGAGAPPQAQPAPGGAPPVAQAA